MRETDLGTQRALYILGVRVPLSLSGAPKGRTAYTRTPFVLQGHTLPLWVETVRVYEEETVPVTFTEEEAQRRALENLHQLQKFAHVWKTLRRRRRSPCLKSLKIRRL